MTKKKSKRKSKQRPKRATRDEARVMTQGTPVAEENDPIDYGGLPDRDLKKNLGCG